ncbi:MAG: hypothetical protein NTU98_02910 [Bacteroidetes bacterium]|nr:hypothetical protein [Bacteroidota bacterium]
MSPLKLLPSLLLCLVIHAGIAAQTLVGFKAGVNYAGYRNAGDEASYRGTYTIYPSYGFGFDVKGRKSKIIHLGASFEYCRSSANWQSISASPGGSYNRNVNYHVEWLRLSLYPELTFGNRFMVIFNFSPYVSIRVHSSMEGTSWISYGGHTYTTEESGPVGHDLNSVDIGIKENLGFGFKVIPSLVLSVEETGSLGLFPVSSDFVKTQAICVFFCASWIIPRAKAKAKE